jgi:hypothetical protein
MSTITPNLVGSSTDNSGITSLGSQTPTPYLITSTIVLPPATQTEIDGLIADLRTAVQKYSALADKIDAAVPVIQGVVTTEIAALQASVQEVADAIKNFKLSGPLGIHGQSA